jgi:hypothetical protein
MTSAEFIAACFWPLIVLFGVLLPNVRDRVLFRGLATGAAAIGFLYLGLEIFYPQSSMIAVVDFYVLIGLAGFVILGLGYSQLKYSKRGRPPKSLKEKLAGYGALFFGVSALWMSGSTLFPDFAQPRQVLEGRAENLRTSGRRRADRLVDIAGRTVKATAPVYERLQFKPYVRVEVGQGSNYIYRIEYLAN